MPIGAACRPIYLYLRGLQLPAALRFRRVTFNPVQISSFDRPMTSQTSTARLLVNASRLGLVIREYTLATSNSPSPRIHIDFMRFFLSGCRPSPRHSGVSMTPAMRDHHRLRLTRKRWIIKADYYLGRVFCFISDLIFNGAPTTCALLDAWLQASAFLEPFDRGEP